MLGNRNSESLSVSVLLRLIKSDGRLSRLVYQKEPYIKTNLVPVISRSIQQESGTQGETERPYSAIRDVGPPD